MPWWSWIVIWVALVLLALGVLVWLAFRLFGKLTRAFEALGDLADQMSALGANVEALAPERKVPAIFGNRDALASAIEIHRTQRANARQLRRDRLISRGKLLQRAPLTQRTPPNA